MTFFQRSTYHLCKLLAALWIGLFSLSALAALGTANSAVVLTEQVRAELIAHAPQGATPGSDVWVGLKLTHAPHWHSYWKNSGDSGQATTLQWTLPAGVQAGPIAWPTPQILRIGSLINYGYENTVLLAVPLTISPEFKSSLITPNLRIALQASWLVCKTECIPQEGSFSLDLPLKSSTAINAGDFQTNTAHQPQAINGASAVTISGSMLKFEVSGLPDVLRGQTLDLFPETPEVIETSAPWTQSWQDGTWQALVPINRYRSASPAEMPLVIAGSVKAQRQGFSTLAKVLGPWPAAKAASTTATPALLNNIALSGDAALAVPVGVSSSLWLALVGAFIGGMILNLMPCVFPVLAIKVVGFTRKPGATHNHRVQGLSYSAGVVLSFMALGALMLVLRSAGTQLGWGFQLQSPAMVAGLAVLFTLIGLNLAGVFEVSQLLPNSMATLEAKNPVVNAFLSGVLAVLIASPCTAPLMGASLGLALSLPALDAMLIFTTLGLGMAIPYLAASWSTRLAYALPRPGAWMNIFRHAMAFPMFATVAWLLWVLGQQTGIDGAAALMTVLVALSMLVWALHLHGRARMPMALVALALLAGLLFAVGPYVVRYIEPINTSTSARWQAWSTEKVDTLLANRQAVFVDFTAAWCVTCQVNKQTTLTDAGVLADFDARKVTLLRADWTRPDPAIAAALRALGRSGVPAYVLYAPGRPAHLLTELLSPTEVHAALAKL